LKDLTKMKIFVKDIKVGEMITDTVFSVTEFREHKDKNGNIYYKIFLSDKSGSIGGNIWADKIANCEIRDLKVGEVVSVDAQVDSFKEKVQLNILKLTKLKEDEADMSDLLQMSRFDIDELWDRLMENVKKIEDKDIKKLLLDILKDEKIVKQYRSITAGIGVHHDFIGGLLEHVVEMIDMANSMRTWYKEANFDIVVAGIVLHDIGKTEEIVSVGSTFEKTTKGKLIGHIVLGVELVTRFLPKDFPVTKWTQLEHIILSHHRLLEYGAVIVPSTIEAIIVASIDNLSAQTRIFQQVLSKHTSDSDFTEYSKYANTSIYLPNREMLEKINSSYSLKEEKDDILQKSLI